MRYGSLFSGIEAASVAWKPLGWKCEFVAEIEPFPSAVLAHHYPDVPNLGDVTQVNWQEVKERVGSLDVLVFGSPCQSFSVAGKRLGLGDPRGNLALVALGIVDVLRPRWFIFENVPGLLSSGGGRDFGAFLGTVDELGYSASWRVLDAQYVRTHSHPRAVPQRRRRVFVVGHLGDWRRAAAVLFERESLSGYPAPRREAGQAAPTIPSRSTAGGGLGTDFDCDGGLVADVASTLNAHYGDKQGLEDQHINQGAPLFVTHSLRADGFGASEDGTGGQVVVAFANTAGATNLGISASGEAPPITTRNGDPGNVMLPNMAVRRLTPEECEALQGFPRSYTNIPWRNKPHAPDGPRYKALGNSFAVNVVRWLGERIQMVEEVIREHARRAA